MAPKETFEEIKRLATDTQQLVKELEEGRRRDEELARKVERSLERLGEMAEGRRPGKAA